MAPRILSDPPPQPSPQQASFTDEDTLNHGFPFVEREKYTNDVSFSVEELANCLTTQSNVVAAIEEGTRSIEEVRRWLVDSLASLFRGPTGTFEFGGYIWCLQGVAQLATRLAQRWGSSDGF